MKHIINIIMNMDWFAFFDFDEFLTFEKDKTIKEYLLRDCFKDYNQILINWKVYTDNDLVYDDCKPCLERFTIPMDIYKAVWNDNPLNEHVKPIIRNNIQNITFSYSHCINGDILENTTCNNSGKQVNVSPFVTINYDLAYIKHFCYKTIEEFINNKLKKFKSNSWELKLRDKDLQFNVFFKINNLTDKKLEYIKNKGYIYNE